MEELRSFKQPLIISAAVHLIFAVFLLIDWGADHQKAEVLQVQHVKASLVTKDPFQKQKQEDLAKKRKQWQAERQRKADQERKRVAAEKKKIADEKKRKEAAKRKAAEKKKQEALALKKKEAEKKRLAEEKKKAEARKKKQEAERLAKEELAKQEAELAKQEEERKKQAQEEKERKELEALEKELAELEKQNAQREANSAQQEEMNNLFLQVIAIIQESIQSNWELPPGYDSQWNVVLRLHFQPDGDLRKVETVRSSGNSAFDRSAEQAAWRMGTIPEIRDLDEVSFNKLRRIKLEFAPELDG